MITTAVLIILENRLPSVTQGTAIESIVHVLSISFSLVVVGGFIILGIIRLNKRFNIVKLRDDTATDKSK